MREEEPKIIPDVPVGEVRFNIPISAKEFDQETGTIKRPTALNKIREHLERNPKGLEWLEKIGVDIEEGNVNARFYGTVGAVVFLIGVGVEVGVRKGEDVRKLINYIKEHRQQRKK